MFVSLHTALYIKFTWAV